MVGLRFLHIIQRIMICLLKPILGEITIYEWCDSFLDSSAWTMNPVGPYYWPLKDKIQFFSYSPVANVSYVKPTSSKAGFGQLPKFSILSLILKKI